jgi:hypothetical protein
MSELRTAVEVALDKLEAREPIPKMTHPLSKHWEQPDRREIEIDATHAMMSQKAFEALHEYSCSQPSGVYEGKMWRRHHYVFNVRGKTYYFYQSKLMEEPVHGCALDQMIEHMPVADEWLLCWFDKSEKGPDYCATRTRKILIV